MVVVVLTGACTSKAAPTLRALSVTAVYTIPTPTSHPAGIAAGPDGYLWFVETAGNKVAKMSSSGLVIEYLVPTVKAFVPPLSGGTAPGYIAAGRGGELWFTEYGGNNVAKVTASGEITEHPIPSANAYPEAITLGPDGNIWFTESGTDKVAKVTPSGAITEYPTSRGAVPHGITAGPDGNIWITENGSGQVARVTTAGVVTEYQVPGDGRPGEIAAGSDGALWFTEWSGSTPTVARITTLGTVTEFTIPEGGIPVAYPLFIAAGPDGNLWFTMNTCDWLGRVTTSGVFTAFTHSEEQCGSAITSAPDGYMWMVGGNELVKFAPNQ